MCDREAAIAAGVLLWDGGAGAARFLLLRNARHGTWGFAKGHLEPGESLLEGALRECREETGVALAAADLLPDFADACSYELPRGGRKRLVMFLAGRATAESALARSKEHDAHAWLPAAEALERLAHEEQRRTIVRADVRLARARP